MLYIHGGAFMHESSLDSAPDLFVNNEVIFVSINYRLGPFGNKIFHFLQFFNIFISKTLIFKDFFQHKIALFPEITV